MSLVAETSRVRETLCAHDAVSREFPVSSGGPDYALWVIVASSVLAPSMTLRRSSYSELIAKIFVTLDALGNCKSSVV